MLNLELCQVTILLQTCSQRLGKQIQGRRAFSLLRKNTSRIKLLKQLSFNKLNTRKRSDM